MSKEFYSIHEIMELFELSEAVLEELMEGDIICPYCPAPSGEKRLPFAEMEKLRLAKLLMDMDVNVPGIEIILRMRQSMFDMRRQFDDILRDLLLRFKDAFNDRDA